MREKSMSKKRLEAFDSFNELMTFRNIYDTSKDELSRYACISVGSDQIWALRRFRHGEKWAYLRFADRNQRIALAPSLGVGSVSKLRQHRLAKYLEGFDELSIREENGARIIKSATGRDADVICDPTLVLDADEWRQVANDRMIPASPYVFAYLLGETGLEAQSVLDLASNNGEIPIVMLSDRERVGELPAGPAEFISLIDNASHVVTDSFHAAVFSAIFQTPLTIVHRESQDSAYSNMFGRLETLADKLSIQEKIFNSETYDIRQAADYSGVKEAIEKEQAKFIEYLETCLASKIPDWQG
jgi:hypothetical protein